ncbi:hypothetical protein B0T17DRAFT_612298 [Bombardia bombarda]|uniref:Uncharacterized protein n=1 Tax=Bombardia bombarda TaxID=252184 RepID=A0AA39XJZ8_9PEZI|nr:hypothetical protein B0T17DRAFT_612298 [Bombardia bombarda]
MPTRRLLTAQKFIAVIGTLDPFRPASLSARLPASLDKQGFLQHAGNLGAILAGFPVTAKEYIESDEATNRVTVWATSKAVFRDDAKDGDGEDKDWEFSGEYVLLLTMDETGERITRIVEFLDSKATADVLLGLMERARGNVESKGKRGRVSN